MAHAARNILSETYPDIPVNIEVLKEQNAFGNGTGIMYVLLL